MRNIIGQVFGSRTVLSIAGQNKNRELTYLCRCKCGQEKVVAGVALRSGKSHSCNACAAAKTKNATTHGQRKADGYHTWKDMISRCSNPKAVGYENYGGRGISVCDEWKGVSVFLEWRNNSGYEKGLTLDRIDVDKGYFPANCRWATRKEQRENVQLITKSNTSGYRGVSPKHGRNKWLARITVDYKIVHLGHHDTPELAAMAYDKYIRREGLIRPLNFPYEVQARELSGY